MRALFMTGSPQGIDSRREAGPLDRWQASCIALSVLCGQAVEVTSSEDSSSNSSSSSFVSVRAAVTHSVVMTAALWTKKAICALLMKGRPQGIDSSREAGPLDRWQASCIALSTLCGQAAGATQDTQRATAALTLHQRELCVPDKA
jgi:hypothetical protein